MAIRKIRQIGDSVLTKTAKEVTGMSLRTKILIDDMLDTMYEANGVGLAETSGEQTGNEGCLSVPGKTGVVTRPNYVKVVALDTDMKPFELEGTELLARAICHECEHLDGHLYVEKVEGELMNVEDLDDEDDEEASV